MPRARRAAAPSPSAPDTATARPRIAYLVSQYPAPSHTFIRREVASLRGLGVDVATCSIRPGLSLSERDRAEQDATFYVLRPPWSAFAWELAATFARRPARWVSTLRATLAHRLPGVAGLARSAIYFAEAMRLACELERRRVTHVHNHFSNAAAHVGAAAARYLGVDWSFTVHGLSDLEGPNAALLPRKVAAARFVACATRYARAQLMRATPPSEWTKLHLVRCGIDPDLLPAPPRRGPAGGPLELVSVARLAPEKGHAGLIEAFAEVIRRGVDARLTLVGGGPEEPRIRAAIAAHGVADRVALEGALPEPAALEAIARAHVLVLSSLAEGLPVVLMEALALGVPVVAPAINGIPELVVHGETGLLYTVGHWLELADRIAALAADPELRARLATAGRARTLQEFDVRTAVAPLAALFGDQRRRSASAGVALRSIR